MKLRQNGLREGSPVTDSLRGAICGVEFRPAFFAPCFARPLTGEQIGGVGKKYFSAQTNAASQTSILNSKTFTRALTFG